MAVFKIGSTPSKLYGGSNLTKGNKLAKIGDKNQAKKNIKIVNIRFTAS